MQKLWILFLMKGPSQIRHLRGDVLNKRKECRSLSLLDVTTLGVPIVVARNVACYTMIKRDLPLLKVMKIILYSLKKLQKEIEEKMKEDGMDSSNWIVPRNPDVMETTVQDIQVKEVIHNKSTSTCQTATNPSQIVEVTGAVDPGLKTSCSYMVQLPSSENMEEIILTPPLATEAPLRFSKRNASGMQDKIEDKAKKLASKKNLEGLQQGEDAKELRTGAEMIRTSTLQLLKMCGAVKQPIQGA
nr:uncharacterized protein LOC123497273 [Aegilops tauschii subsp. strangulata]